MRFHLRSAVVGLALLLLAARPASADGFYGPQTDDSRVIARLAGSGGKYVTWSDDGSRILTVGDGTARVWDARTFASVGEPLRHDTPVVAAAITADGRRVLTGGKSELRVWDVATGKPVGPRLATKDEWWAADLSSDGSLVAVAEGKTARVYDPATGRATVELPHKEDVAYVLFSPDGRSLLTIDDPDDRASVGRLFDARTGIERVPPLKGIYTDGIRLAAFTKDGTRVAATGPGGPLVWDSGTGRLVLDGKGKFLKDDGAIGWTTSVAFDAAGGRMVVGFGGSAACWDVAAGRQAGTSRGVGCTTDAVLSPDGTRMLTAAEGRGGVFDAATAAPVMATGLAHETVPSGPRVPAGRWSVGGAPAAFSPDGTRVAVGHRGPALKETLILRLEPDRPEKE